MNTGFEWPTFWLDNDFGGTTYSDWYCLCRYQTLSVPKRVWKGVVGVDLVSAEIVNKRWRGWRKEFVRCCERRNSNFHQWI